MRSPCSCFLILCLLMILAPYTTQLQSSQAWSLLRIQRLLNYPSFLSSWNKSPDFCISEPNPFVTIVCYDDSITQLQISGNSTPPPLPQSFSIDSFFTTLTRLPNLKVLSLTNLGLWGALPSKISRLSSLEIVNMSSNFLYGPIPHEVSNLKSLQTLILDHNMFAGRVPDWLGGLSLLAVVSMKNNTLNGSLPDSLKNLESLRVLDLSLNNFSGPLPDLSGLTNLQVLDLEGNYLGPQFPMLGKKVVILDLRRNRFTGGLPSDLSSYYHLKKFDVSLNSFVGPFMPALLSLPLIRYLDIAGNRFTGMLFQNMSCNEQLEYVDLSANLLTGNLPTCLISDPKSKVVSYSANCLASNDRSQHPNSFCQTQALAVGILPDKQKKASSHKVIIAISVVAAVVVASSLVALLFFFVFRRSSARRAATTKPPRRLIEHASNGYPSKMLADARYISQTMKLGALGVPSYRSFSLEELEAATNNFNSSTFMGEGSHGQMYRGRLKDGSLVAIRCLKLKKSHSSQNFNRHIELISKLRYRHLVSALGHCFEYYLDDSTVSRLFLIFEYVSNGTLRSNISEEGGGQKLTWTQRIAAAIGVAKGVQFLHAGIIPGLFANDLKTTNILLDQNLVAKISSYNLPVLAENMKNEVIGGSSSNGSKMSNERCVVNVRIKHGDKVDIYDFGVILLEMISGRSISSQADVETVKDQLQASTTFDGSASKKNIVDPVVRRGCCHESLKTVIEICFRCLSKQPINRPSVEDVLWNLQFAAQVQEAWRGDNHSSEGSSVAPSPIN
ncbi:probable inactive leucine-rich repeat receptor-like protein kinase At3g03770 isoform X1 [Asparagus officinalis]|uniref:probable inactive leucine-rich repeat receptor-like protein kinase At3g03770 isoform X1 n=1 Tax=Asparagus officinalis TaxID=4686 RepID=UPI00098E1FE7|nr:probable inactive leucine-rich repeat receptor-like protein kinase At3g03770 isoform X1 [Asparagus officinalis]